MLVAIGTDCIGICKSNYKTITTTTALFFYFANMFVPKFHYHEYCYSDSNISESLTIVYSARYIPYIVRYDTYGVSEVHRLSSRMALTDTVFIVFVTSTLCNA